MGIVNGKACLLLTVFLWFCRVGYSLEKHSTQRGLRVKDLLDETNINLLNREKEDEDDEDNDDKIIKFRLWEPYEIRDQLILWEKQYPDLVRVTTAQKEYDLPTAGRDSDCPYEQEQAGCLNYVITLQDFVAHPVGSESSKFLPEVMWSGEVHGNERVGPTSVLEATKLLLEATTCEAAPKLQIRPKVSPHESYNDQLAREMEYAQSCRQDLYDTYKLTDEQRQWIARLVTTRRIVIIPTANALGYYRSQREEENVDPNRDFPYDLANPQSCMQTIAARTINEVFRDHLFQLALTFHGGMEAIGYEWGATSYLGFTSPDDVAQNQIAAAYSIFAGGWKDKVPYEHGPMNDLVYPVRGGMEDWAYAGSWDTKHQIQCKPTTYGGYSTTRTTYHNATLRAFNMLVETSNNKIPKSQLGTSKKLLAHTNGGFNGHVARNIRLALLSAELVEPYISIVSVNELMLSDDIVPLAPRDNLRCKDQKLVRVPAQPNRIVVRWNVGGAIHIDETSVWYGKWEDLVQVDDSTISNNKGSHPVHSRIDCGLQPSQEIIEKYLKRGEPRGGTSGQGRFQSTSSGKPDPPFTAFLDVTDYEHGDELVVIAAATVDQEWKNMPDDRSNIRISPKGPPQSHIVNARTNPNWYHEHEQNTSVVQGRLVWYSIPLTIQMWTFEKNPSAASNDDEDGFPSPVRSVEVSARFEPFYNDDTGIEMDSHGTWITVLRVVGLIIVGVLIWWLSRCIALRVKRWSNSRGGRRSRNWSGLRRPSKMVVAASAPTFSDYAEDENLNDENNEEMGQETNERAIGDGYWDFQRPQRSGRSTASPQGAVELSAIGDN